MISIIAIIIALFALFRVPAGEEIFTEENTLERVLKEKSVNVCYINYPPMNLKDPGTGEFSGVFVDIFESITEKSNFRTNYVESTWGNIVLDLKSKRCDVNIAGIYPLIERSTGGVIFSRPVLYIGNNGIVKKGDNRFDNLDDLNRSDITIAVVEGEQGHLYAKKYLTAANLHVISSSDQSLAFLEVSAGRADVGLGDSFIVERYLKTHDDVKPLLEEPYLLRALTLAVRAGDQDWLNFLNNGINVLEASGELDTILSEYDDMTAYRHKIIWETV